MVPGIPKCEPAGFNFFSYTQFQPQSLGLNRNLFRRLWQNLFLLPPPLSRRILDALLATGVYWKGKSRSLRVAQPPGWRETSAPDPTESRCSFPYKTITLGFRWWISFFQNCDFFSIDLAVILLQE